MGMLNVGDLAPEIDAAASDGKRFVLSQQDALCTVVYFFPKAFTPGCTGEAKRFGDNYNEIRLAGAHIVGISTDDADTQCRFADSLRAPFPMIGDADRSIARNYGVLWPLIGLTRRVTFIINPQRTIEAIFRHEIKIVLHRDEVLRFINAKFRAQRAER
jgi:peroxiredoxin